MNEIEKSKGHSSNQQTKKFHKQLAAVITHRKKDHIHVENKSEIQHLIDCSRFSLSLLFVASTSAKKTKQNKTKKTTVLNVRVW